MTDPMRSRGVVSEPKAVAQRVGHDDHPLAPDRNDPMWRGYVARLKAERDAALARVAELEAELKSPGALRRRLAHHALDLLRASGELGGTRHAPPC